MENVPIPARPSGRWAVRATVACLLIGLAALATFALSAQHAVVDEAGGAAAATRLAAVYQDARYWVGQEESLERKYRLEPSTLVLTSHDQAQRNLTADLHRLLVLAPAPGARGAVEQILDNNAEYEQVAKRMFAAVALGNARLVRFLDRWVTDPIFTVVQGPVYVGLPRRLRPWSGRAARCVETRRNHSGPARSRSRSGRDSSAASA